MTTPGRRAPAISPEESDTAGARTLPGLTPREVQVMDLVVKGLGNQEIADRLGIGLSTAKNHLLRAYPKLGATNRTEAAMLWAKSGGRARAALEHATSALAGATIVVGQALDQLRETP